MQNNKYVKLHSLLRMFACLLTIIVFISMFITKHVVHSEMSVVFCDFNNGAFFGDDVWKGNVLGFIGYILVIVGGLAGLVFVFIDELIGKDLTKTLSFVAGGLIVLGALFILFFAPVFKGINHLNNDFHTGVGPIVFGIIALLAGGANIAAPILEDKGY